MKKLIFLICCFVLTGCTAKYDMTITSNNKFQESFTFIADNSILKMDNYTLKESIKQRIDGYKNAPELKDYKITYKIGEKNTTFHFKSPFLTIKQLNQSSILKNGFEEIQLLKEGKNTIFQTVGEYYYYHIFGETNDADGYSIDAQVSITPHYKVLKNNADKVDEKTNTYTWYLKSNELEKSLQLKYSNQKRYDVIFNYYLKEYLPFLVIGGIILLILVTGGFIFYRKYKSTNEI